MATKSEEKQSATQLKKEEAERKQQERVAEANRKEILKTISSGFSSIEKSNLSIHKCLEKQTELLKTTSTVTKSLCSSFEKYSESSGKKLTATSTYSKMAAMRLGTLIKMQREMNGDNTIKLDDKQFGQIIKNYESFQKRLERIADYSEMTAKRLWTVIGISKEDANNNTIKLDDKQWEVIKKIRERLVDIQRYTDFTSSRVWVLQDLIKDNTKTISSGNSLIIKSLKTISKDLGDIFDLLYSSNNDTGKIQSKNVTGVFALNDKQFIGLLSTIKNAPQPDKFLRLLGGGSGNSAGHLHHIRALMRTLIKSVRNIGGFGENEETTNNLSESHARKIAEKRDGAAQNPETLKWMNQFVTLWNRLSDNFMGVFQRGVIGRISSLNPLIGLATDIFRDIAQTVEDIGGTIWQAYLVLAHLGRRRAASSGTTSAEAPNMLDKFKGMLTSIASLASDFAAMGFVGKLGMLMGGVKNAIIGIKNIFGKIFSFSKVLGKKFVIVDSVINFFSNIFDDFSRLEDGGIVKSILLVAGRAIISVGEAMINAIVDTGTWMVGKLLSWMGFADIGKFLTDFDFSGWISKNVGELMTTLLNLMQGGFLSSVGNLVEFFSVAIESIVETAISGLSSLFGFDSFSSWIDNNKGFITEWIKNWFFGGDNEKPAINKRNQSPSDNIDSAKKPADDKRIITVNGKTLRKGDDGYDEAKARIDRKLAEGEIEADRSYANIQKQGEIAMAADTLTTNPAIEADAIKSAQQNLGDSQQTANVTMMSAPSTTVISQPAQQPVPYSTVSASNATFSEF